MMRLRTGTISLADYLAKTKALDSLHCVRGLGNEMVNYALMRCERWTEEHHGIRLELFNRDITMMLEPEELRSHEEPRFGGQVHNADRPDWPIERGGRVCNRNSTEEGDEGGSDTIMIGRAERLFSSEWCTKGCHWVRYTYCQ
jgi:hypothetical protein